MINTKRIIPFVMATSTLCFANTATAESGYVGAQITNTSITLSSPFDSVEWEPTNLIFVGGLDFNDYVAVEGRLGFGLSAGSVEGFELETSSIAGIYGKVSLPEKFSPYAILGYSSISLDSNGGSFGSESSLSYGIGADFNVSREFSLNIEYMSYYSDSQGDVDLDITAIGIGGKYRF